MNFLAKLSTFGRFSIKDSPSELIIKQRNYVGILLNLLIISFFIFILVLQISYKGIESLAIKSPKDMLGLIFAVGLLYFFGKNIFILSHAQMLKIDKMKRLIVYEGIEIRTDRINYADLIKEYSTKGCYYHLIIYLKIGKGKANIDLDNDDKELTGIDIFQPTFYSKNLMLFLANEINNMTEKRKIIENKFKIHELLGILYLLAAIAALSFVPYLLIKHSL